MKQFLYAALLCVGLGTSLVACKKDDDSDNDVTLAKDQANAELIYNDVATMADLAVAGNTLYRFDPVSPAGLKITRDTIFQPVKLTIDFGKVSAPCKDGRSRRGKIVIEYYGDYYTLNQNHSISFVDYAVDNNEASGTITSTNVGPNNFSQTVYNLVINGQVRKAANGKSYTWNAQRVKEVIAGYTTPDPTDDVYLLSGKAAGVADDGTEYTDKVIEKLKRNFNCNWNYQGVTTVYPKNRVAREMHYAAEACSSTVTIYIDQKGQEQNIQ